MLRNEFNIYCLGNDYKYLYNIFSKLQHHIYKLFELYIIDIIEKNLFINELYELSMTVNIEYNNIIHLYNQDTNEELNKTIVYYKNNFNVLYDLINNNYIANNINHVLKYKIIHPLKLKIKEKMFNLMNNIGFTSINDFYKFIDMNKTVDLQYCDFIPLKIYKTESITHSFKITKTINPPTKIFLLCFDICIENYCIQGIFLNDYLNLSTRVMSQIIYPVIYEKRRKLLEEHIDNSFKIKYLKYCDKGEIIGLTYDEINEMLIKHEKLYIKIKNKTFTSLMQYFSTKSDNPIEIFNIVKLLLLGTEDNINVAGMLFLVLREKKSNNIMIADLIYNSLNFVSQIKLKMVNINIESEIKQLNELSYNDTDLQKQMTIVKTMPNYVKNLINEKINEMKLNNNDYHKQYIYVKTLIDFPWPNQTETKLDIKSDDPIKCIKYFTDIEVQLNKITYGHIQVKEKILLHLAECVANPDANGYIMSFYGPPGVGKTLIAQSLAKVLNIPIIIIPLGGHNDSEILHGTAYTYSSSQPGLIIKEIVRVGTTKCILYLDELDKTSTRNEKSHNEINAIISQLTDPNMNSHFQDRFFQGIEFPLKNLIIIASYNSNESFDKSLLNRFDEITIKPYNLHEKIHIVKHFIIKEICKEMKFNFEIVIDDIVLKYILMKYTRESGVRDMKRKIKLIIMKLNKLKLTNKINNIVKDNKIILEIDDINFFLKDEYIYDTINFNHEDGEIGIINGLYAGNGSGVLSIQIDKYYNFDNTFTLKFTGSQSEEMKESVYCAYTNAINYIAIVLKFNNYEKLKKHIINDYPSGFHIHVNDICTSKDGSSGGCAFALAFISLILNKPIKNNIAITGELNIKNKILAVGNIESKVISAKNNGIQTVLIPKANCNDIMILLRDMPDLFDATFQYQFISNLKEAVNLCL
jgi:ATP-dependent Lon protease